MEFPLFGLRELGHFDGGEKIHLAFDQSMFLALLVQLRRKKGKEREKEEKESLVWKFQDIKVRKNIPTLSLFVFFFSWFELGLRLDWILFWFGLEFSGDKDQKCVKRHVGILGEVLSKFS